MQLLSAFLLALCANVDNIPIGIAYGVRKIQIRLQYNFLISFILSIFTFIAMCFGEWISALVQVDSISKVGCLVLIIWGCIVVSDSAISYAKQDDQNITPMSLKGAILLAMLLTVNNAAVGISANLAGVSVIETCIFTFFLSMFFLRLGLELGKKSPSFFKPLYAQLISGFLMILLGFFELFL